MLTGEALGVFKQRPAYSLPIMLLVHGDIGNVANLGSTEEVLHRLQVDEADALTIVILGHEYMRAGGLVIQMPGNVEANVFGAFAGTAPGGKFETINETIDQTEYEFVVIGIGKTNMDVGNRVHLTIPWGWLLND